MDSPAIQVTRQVEVPVQTERACLLCHLESFPGLFSEDGWDGPSVASSCKTSKTEPPEAPDRSTSFLLDLLSFVEGLAVLLLPVPVVAQPQAVLLVIIEVADHPELAGLAMKDPLPLHLAARRLPLGADRASIVVVGQSVSLLLKGLLTVLVVGRLLHGSWPIFIPPWQCDDSFCWINSGSLEDCLTIDSLELLRNIRTIR